MARPEVVPKPSRDFFWENADKTYAAIAKELGVESRFISGAAGRYGFVRFRYHRMAGYSRGPCVVCRKLFEVAELDGKHRCGECAHDQDADESCICPRCCYKRELGRVLTRRGIKPGYLAPPRVLEMEDIIRAVAS
jgi:hypothetical protein